MLKFIKIVPVFFSDKCNLHHVELSWKKPYINHVREKAHSDVMKKQEEMKLVNKGMNEACTSLVNSVHDLCMLYQLTETSMKLVGSFGKTVKLKQGKVTFLSAVDSRDYFEQEEKFTTQLSEYTKKEFFEGVADLTGQNSREEFQLLDLTQAKTICSAGRQEEYEELEQGNRIFPMGESKRVQAFVEDMAVQAALSHAKKFSLPDTTSDKSQVPRKLQANVRHEQGKLDILKHDLLKLQEEMPILIKCCAEAMMSEFLQGDYDLKIKRQDFFHAKQNRVIEELLQQRSRTELITMCLAAEQRQHSLNRKLVVAVCLYLQSLLDIHNQLETVSATHKQSSQKYNKSTIDSRRKDLIDLHGLLSHGRRTPDQTLFLTFDQLVDFAKQLANDMSQADDKVYKLNIADRNKLMSFINNIHQQDMVLFPPNSKPGQQKLSMPQVAEASSNLCDILDQLEKPALQLIKNVTHQSDALSSDQLTQVGRDLYVAFFNDPEKLRRIFKNL